MDGILVNRDRSRVIFKNNGRKDGNRHIREDRGTEGVNNRKELMEEKRLMRIKGMGEGKCAWTSVLDLLQMSKWPERCKVEYKRYPSLVATLKKTLRRDCYIGSYLGAIEEVKMNNFNIQFPADPFQLLCAVKMTMMGAEENNLELQPITKVECASCAGKYLKGDL